jgi:hypothetical protein
VPGHGARPCLRLPRRAHRGSRPRGA